MFEMASAFLSMFAIQAWVSTGCPSEQAGSTIGLFVVNGLTAGKDGRVGEDGPETPKARHDLRTPTVLVDRGRRDVRFEAGAKRGGAALPPVRCHGHITSRFTTITVFCV